MKKKEKDEAAKQAALIIALQTTQIQEPPAAS